MRGSSPRMTQSRTRVHEHPRPAYRRRRKKLPAGFALAGCAARLARNRAAVVSLAVLAVIALMALLAPWISPHPSTKYSGTTSARHPTSPKAHWFGTDANGRDLFARTLTAAASRFWWAWRRQR